MPIPENPQSRSEQYLNAIATGDNSGLPEFPQSRMEQYLEVIAQNGGGGSSGGGVLVVHVDLDTRVLDKTWQEIYDAPFAVLKMEMSANSLATYYVTSVEGEDGNYYIYIKSLDSQQPIIFTTDSPDGYPVADE